MKYLLDVCAVITQIDNEDGADKVDQIYRQAASGEAEVSITGVRLLEVYYDRGRAKGWDYAEGVFNELTHSAVRIIYTLSPETLKTAGRLKVAYSIPLADAIVCAAAQDRGVYMVTSNHAELEPVEAGEPISFYRLPAKPKKPAKP